MSLFLPQYEKGELRNIGLYACGEWISLLGTSVFTFAISLYVLKLTGSGLSFAITLIQGILPVLLISPIAGVLADRFNKKWLVILMDILNGGIFILLFFICRYFGLTLPIIYVTTFLVTSLSIIFGVSIGAAKPNLVKDSHLIKINAISQVIHSLSSILGPVIGGLVFGIVDIQFFILFNGISFFISGLSEAFIDYEYNSKQKNKEHESLHVSEFFKDIGIGFQYMVSQNEIMSKLMVFVVLNFIMGLSITVPLPYAINNILKLDSSVYGIIQGFLPGGMILGAVFIEKVHKRYNYNKIIHLSVLIYSILIICMGLPLIYKGLFSYMFYIVYYSCITMMTGCLISFVDIPIIQILQTTGDEKYRGRVLSMSLSICKIVLPLALILAGWLVEVIPIYLLFIATGTLSVVYSIVIMNKRWLLQLFTNERVKKSSQSVENNK